jgi:hypothetical protein
MIGRRELVKILSSASLAIFAGCSGATKLGTGTGDEATESKQNEGTELESAPTQTDNCVVSTLPSGDYPDLPGEMTSENVTEFVLEFEKTRVQAEIGDRNADFHGFDGWDSSISSESGDEFLVTAWVSVDYSVERSGENGTDLGSEAFRAWYFVNSEFAARAKGETNDPPESGWKTVACS